MTSKSYKSPPPILWILIGLTVWLSSKILPINLTIDVNNIIGKLEKQNHHLTERISWGDKLLITNKVKEQKQQGIAVFNNQDYQQAASYWQQSLAKFPNDPETVIYLNNARIGNGKSYSIIVTAPIGVDVNTAQEILRGVAQAQREINNQGGINDIPLKVAIANDDNDPQVAQKLAQNIVNNPDILGVVGHFSSDVTLAAASVYEAAGLVAISATSTSVSLSSAGDYIFRTVPSDRFAGNALAQYFLERLKQQKAAVFYNSESNYSNSLKDAFSTDLVSNGGEVTAEFDFAELNFDPVKALQQATDRDAEALILLATSSTLNSALSVAEANQNRLPLLAGDDVYTPQTLNNAGQYTVDMVLAIPWHIRGKIDADFPQAASRLWKAEVNWRTALAYDATKALIAGLKHNPNRQGIQQTLSQPQFSITGASGEISFLPSGDRNYKPQLVQVQLGNNSGFGYDFVPID